MQGMGDVHERGRLFEDFLNSLFALFDLSLSIVVQEAAARGGYQIGAVDQTQCPPHDFVVGRASSRA